MKLLDNDLYKFSMGQAIALRYPRAEARYELIVRKPVVWPERVRDLALLLQREFGADFGPLLPDARRWLEQRCPYLTPVYLDWLAAYRFDCDEVSSILGDDGQLRLVVQGPWYRTVLWEVPLMAILSGLYHEGIEHELRPIAERAHAKGKLLAEHGLQVAEGGTRRRYSRAVQELVVDVLAEHGALAGTSNVRLAFLRDLPPVGTVAHEWIMAHAADRSYATANWNAMMNWYDVYKGALGTALSDTYTSAVFRDWFHGAPLKLFDAVRQDSGDPIAWAEAMIAHYRKHDIDPGTKRLVFSDGLTVPRCIEIADAVRAMGGNPSFLIGTDLTCDVPGVTPLNMVIKLTAWRPDADSAWRPTVKLSDVPGKHSGDAAEVARCKRELGIG